MRTTLNIDAKIIEETVNITGISSKSKAVGVALADWVRRKRIEALRGMRGKVEISDDLEEWRGMESREVTGDG